MKLPNAEAANVEIEKLRDYCLSPDHPRGRNKARVFHSLLGMTAARAEELRAALIDAALKEDATLGASDLYGTRYIIDFESLLSGYKSNRFNWLQLSPKSLLQPIS